MLFQKAKVRVVVSVQELVLNTTSNGASDGFDEERDGGIFDFCFSSLELGYLKIGRGFCGGLEIEVLTIGE